MRPFAISIAAVLILATGGRAGEGTKKAPGKKATSKSAYFNPKEITIDKAVPWKKNAQETSQKVKEFDRELGPNGIVKGMIVNVDVKGGFFDLRTAKGEVVRARRQYQTILFYKEVGVVEGGINDVPPFKGKIVTVITQANTPMLFQALVTNEQ